MDQPLANRLALVTGASKGIGAATARALAAAGAHVVLTGRDVPALEAVEDAIHAVGGASTIAPAIAARWDKLDYLVISAAYLPALTPVTQIDGKQLSQALTVNFLATQALLANFDPLLKRAEAGRVIGLTSSVGASPRAYWSAYGATKAAFDNLLESYAQEVEKISKVRVALVDPGATRTAMRVKDPATVADRLVELLVNDFTGFHRERVDG